MFYILIVRRDENRFLVHGSVTKTFLIKNMNQFIIKEDGSKCPHRIQVIEEAILPMNKYVCCVIVRNPDNTFEVPFISVNGSSSECRKYAKDRARTCKTKDERQNFRYCITWLTCNNTIEKEEDKKYLDNTDEDGRIKCYYSRRSSGEYDIYSSIPDESGNTHLGYVDDMKELREFFDDKAYHDRYFCLDI